MYKKTLNWSCLRQAFFSVLAVFAFALSAIGITPDAIAQDQLDTPELLSPANNATLTNYPREAELEWVTILDAEFYEVEIGCDWCNSLTTQYASPKVVKASSNTYTYTASGDNQHRWRVRAGNSDGYGGWSGYYYFKYDTSTQSSTTLKSPRIETPYSNEKLTHYPRSTYISWSEVPGADSYTVEVGCDWCNSTSTKFKDPKVVNVGNSPLYYYDAPGDNQYRVRVQASGGPWSDYVYFSYDTSGADNTISLKAPQLLHPKDGVTLYQYPREVEFEWSGVTGADGYEVEISCDYCSGTKKFGSPESYKTANTWYVYTLAGDNEYRWRVRAHGGPWSGYFYLKSDTSGHANQPVTDISDDVRKYSPEDAPDICQNEVTLHLNGTYRFCAGTTVTDPRGAKFFVTNEVNKNYFNMLDWFAGGHDLKLYQYRPEELIDNRYGQMDVTYFDHEWGGGRLWIYLNFGWRDAEVSSAPVSNTSNSNAPTKAECERLKRLWDQGDFTARFGHLMNDVIACKNKHYSQREWDKDTSDYPLLTKCAKIKALHDKHGPSEFSSRYKKEAKDAEKCQKEVYGQQWWWGTKYSSSDRSNSNRSNSGSDRNEPVYRSDDEPPAGYEREVRTEFAKNPFTDTVLHQLEGLAAAELYTRAIIGGYPDGEFKGNRPVNRAELAKFLLLARFGDPGEEKNSGKFKDIKEGEWYVRFVMKAFLKGIIQGYADGNFRPGDPVNTAEFLKMLVKTFDLADDYSHDYADVPSGSWYEGYAGVAAKYDLFPKRGNRLEPARELTRNEVAVAIYQYLKNR